MDNHPSSERRGVLNNSAEFPALLPPRLSPLPLLTPDRSYRGLPPSYAWLLLLLLLPPGAAWSQDYPYAVPQYDFIQYQENHLHTYTDSSNLTAFYEKVDRLIYQGEGQIRILQIGGSHIQADMWSDRIRQRMQTFYPGNRGARGFLFPYRMAKTNNPYNYRPEYTGTWESCRNVESKRPCTLGLSGISVTTTDTLSTLKIYYRGDDYPRYGFNRVKVFHNLDSTSFFVFLDEPGARVTARKDVAGGFTEFSLDRETDTLRLRFVRTDTVQENFTLYGLSLENDEPGIIYSGVGVNGAATRSYTRCKLFSQHLKAVPPDLVILSIGINDAYVKEFDPALFERRYDTLVTMIKAASPQTAILFTTNNDSYYKRRYPNKNAEAVRTTMQQLARKHHAGLWDMYGVMGGLGSIRKWQLEGLAKADKIHLTGEGYALVGDLLFNALLEGYEQFMVRKYSSGKTIPHSNPEKARH